MSGYRRSTPAEFIGVDPALLQQWLTEAQAAMQELSVGKNVNMASYTQGDGTKSVTMTPADIPTLDRRINRLAQALGLGCGGRRAIRVRY